MDSKLDPLKFDADSQDSEPDDENGNEGKVTVSRNLPPRPVSYYRQVKKRRIGDRKEVFYFPSTAPAKRLRSLNDVLRFCVQNDLPYQPEKFDFKTKMAIKPETRLEPGPTEAEPSPTEPETVPANEPDNEQPSTSGEQLPKGPFTEEKGHKSSSEDEYQDA
ncbi:hypothetical protein CHUAL_001505 [Chamberlinius hualienensis]